jgi:DNA-binding CsgD family transcriptional regulator
VAQENAHAELTASVPVAGLSARELQVLQLVAAGRTNQEIATVLFRSPNTVANHVRNILGKTQTSNRTQASAFAVLHNLLPPS